MGTHNYYNRARRINARAPMAQPRYVTDADKATAQIRSGFHWGPSVDTADAEIRSGWPKSWNQAPGNSANKQEGNAVQPAGAPAGNGNAQQPGQPPPAAPQVNASPSQNPTAAANAGTSAKPVASSTPAANAGAPPNGGSPPDPDAAVAFDAFTKVPFSNGKPLPPDFTVNQVHHTGAGFYVDVPTQNGVRSVAVTPTPAQVDYMRKNARPGA